MTIVDLKAQAYDILAQIEFLQKKLQETNGEIAKLMQENEGESKSPTS